MAIRTNTKKYKILQAFKRGEQLTAYKAVAYGTMRLAAYVFSLRADGYNITKTEKVDGCGCKFAEYHLDQSIAA